MLTCACHVRLVRTKIDMSNSNQIPQSQLLQRKINLLPILIAQQLVLLPLYFFNPVWITLLNISIAAFIYLSEIKRPNKSRMKLQMPVWLKVGITLVTAIGVLTTFHKLAGRDAGVALIATMYGLKMLEVKSRRDVYVIMILGFFILLAGFLFDQSPWIALYQFVPILAILNALMSTHSLQASTGLLSQSLGLTFKRLLKYLLLAIPLMIVLFVFFPRLSGPIWKMPGASSATSGISDTMSPGEISSLQLFDKVAFRVKFDGDEPNGNELYWRTLVLDNFDGLTWSRDSKFGRVIRANINKAELLNVDPNSSTDLVEATNKQFKYEISLEKTQLQWLTLLDRPSHIPPSSTIYDDYSVQVGHRLVDRIRYQGQSEPSRQLDLELSERAKKHHTFIPSKGNERSIVWAKEQRLLFSNDVSFIRSILSRINREEYYYTLSPPIMSKDTVDSFWFDEQQGFCEHYASALVFMSRAAGIPARVVVGYQGAEKNPLSDYWIVRYANAHAWTEIWLDNQGWVRVDPTAAIASHRIEEQLQLDYSQRLSLFEEFGFDAVDLHDLGWMKQLQYWLDKGNTGWNDWVLDYNRQAQRRLFSGLGLEKLTIQQISVLMISIIALFMLIISFKWIKTNQKKEPIQSGFALLLKKLDNKGLLINPNVGAKDLLQLVSNSPGENSKGIVIDSKSSNDINRLLKRYIFIRYGQSSCNLGQQQDFLKQVKRLKI